jgi:hypothetical protein
MSNLLEIVETDAELSSNMSITVGAGVLFLRELISVTQFLDILEELGELEEAKDFFSLGAFFLNEKEELEINRRLYGGK